MRKLALIPLIFFCMAGLASADYPEHPIRLIVPRAAGSATDNTARLIAAELSQELGQQVIVDDRPGGAFILGLDLVAKSPPDGYNIGMGPIGALAITRHIVKKLPYNIERDFQPIALVTRGHLLLAVAPTSEAFKEKFAKTGDEPGGGAPEEFAATIEADSANWADVIKRAGIEF